MKFHKKSQRKPPTFKEKSADIEEFADNYQEVPKWYESQISEPKKFGPVTEQVLIELKEEAKKCHDSEVANYNSKNSKNNSDHQWMKTLMNTGTVSDKIAAHTVAIQNNPVCNLDIVRNMVNMVKVGKKKECFAVMETLTELFLTDLLKPHQKLTPFHSKPLSALAEMSSGNAVKRRQILSRWYFEDELKSIFSAFVLALNRAAQDTVENNKEKAITAMFKLLSGTPEQEKNLLSNIVNKLGDPSQKVASKAIYCLTQLIFKHPNMQNVVLQEIEKVLFRPNISNRAQYYCLCFLSQFYLDHEHPEVAKKLIEVYLAFFKACVKKGEVDSRMMSALLMGINRAYPYSKMEFERMAGHVDTLYRLVHMASFNIALQVLLLLYHVTSDKMADRYYAALYRKLGDSSLLTTTHRAMLLSLLYKSLLKDNQNERIKMFIKRLLQISLYVQPSFSCGILYLLSQLIAKKPQLQAIALKELALTDFDLDDDDNEEKYYDIKEEETEAAPIEDTGEDDGKADLKVTFKGSGWLHRTGSTNKKPFKYNPLARNPLFGGGDFLAYTELGLLKNHFHPTVALWADNLLKSEQLRYTGDPLKDFTLIRFLDRFVYKNPKILDNNNTKGAHPTFGKRKLYKPTGVKTLSVNSKSYLNEQESNIPVDELFLYSYLQKRQQNKDEKEEDENSDLESVQSEEFEEMLSKMSGFNDREENDVDFMEEIGDGLKEKASKKKKKRPIDDSDEESDEEIDDEISDMEEDEENDFNSDLNESGSDEVMEFLSDSEEVEKPSKTMKNKKGDITSLFASAEEFAALLDEEGSSKSKPGSSSAVSNKDKASQKQLAWEDKRNRWVKGLNRAVNDKSKKRPKKKSKTN